MVRKVLLRSITIILIVSLGYGVSYIWRALPILSGYQAKIMCSCAYLSGRSESDILEREFNSFPISLGTSYLDASDSSAYGEVLGLAKRKAIYRKGQGCTIISEITEEELRDQKFIMSSPSVLLDTVPWPHGRLASAADSTVDKEQLNRAVNNAFEDMDIEHPKNTRAIVVVHKGKLIVEQYGERFDQSTPQLGWSMTKSVTNAMIGILVKAGKIDIYQKVPATQWAAEDPRSHITVDHLLRMSSGLKWNEYYGGISSVAIMLYNKADAGGYASSHKLENQPDEVWSYSSGTSNILSKAIKSTMNPDEYQQFPYTRLLKKIGITSAVIEPDANGTFIGSSYMFATPRDWARFGLLFLQDGKWDGERILPEGWVKYSTTPTPKASEGRYGAHFWLNAGDPGSGNNRWYPSAPTDMYSMNGFQGQRVFIIPSHDLVIVRMGLSKRGDFDFDEFLKEILLAF